MSQFVTVKTAIRDLDALRCAAREIGLSLEVAVNGQKINARGYKRQTTEADAVVRLKGPYDVACQRQPDGTYSLTTDWFKGHVEKEVGTEFKRLKHLYTAHVSMKAAQSKGLNVQRRTSPTGHTILVLTGPGL